MQREVGHAGYSIASTAVLPRRNGLTSRRRNLETLNWRHCRAIRARWHVFPFDLERDLAMAKPQTMLRVRVLSSGDRGLEVKWLKHMLNLLVKPSPLLKTLDDRFDDDTGKA